MNTIVNRMWRKSNIIICILAFSSCSYFKMDSDTTIYKPYVEQYLTIFIEETESINPKEHFIVVQSKKISDNEYILHISSSLYNNIYLFSNYKDTIYSYSCKGFLVIALDKDKKVIENVTEKNIFIPPYNDDPIPVSYTGEYWELRIKDQKLIDFPYKLEEPYIEIFERLKSIEIPTGQLRMIK